MGMMDFDIGDIGGIFTSAREAITGEKILDPKEMKELEFKFKQLEQSANNGQLSINKIEASHKSLFVAGWRPFIGWVCGVGVAYTFIGYPLLEWGLTFAGSEIQAPAIHDDKLMELVLAMLGMAGLRTFEKNKKVSREK